MGPNYYEVLGVDRDADPAQIKSAWRRACRQVHPDTGGNPGLFALVQEAYRTLSTDDLRADYDRLLEDGGAAGYGPTPPTTDRTPPPPPPGSPAGGSTREPSGGAAGAVVDPTALSWLGEVPDDEPTLTVTPRELRWLPWAARALHAAAFALGFVLTITYNDGATKNISLAAVDDFAVIWAASLLASTRWAWLVLPAVLSWLVFGWSDYVAENATESAWFWTWLLTVAGAAGIRVTLPYVAPPLLNRQVPASAARDFAVFGPAGQPVGIATADSQLAARIGADVTYLLTMLPGVRLFHAVSAPGGGGANHVLVRGNRVAVVTGVAGPTGSYGFSPTGALLRNGQHVPADVALAPAMRAWRTQLPRSTQVRGWVLVAGVDGPVHVDAAGAPDGVGAGSPQQVADEVGAWLAADPAGLVVNRRILAVFARGLPQT